MQFAGEGLATGGGLLFGRRTYEDLLGFWTTTPEPDPFTEVLHHGPKLLVFWSAEDDAGVSDSTLTGLDDPTILGSGALVRALRRRPGCRTRTCSRVGAQGPAGLDHPDAVRASHVLRSRADAEGLAHPDASAATASRQTTWCRQAAIGAQELWRGPAPIPVELAVVESQTSPSTTVPGAHAPRRLRPTRERLRLVRGRAEGTARRRGGRLDKTRRQPSIFSS